MSQLLNQALAVVAVIAFSGALAGVCEGWAFAEKSLGPPGGWGPAIQVEIELGWWNSTTHITSGFVPAVVDASGEAARALGVATSLTLLGGGLAAAYFILMALCDIFSVSVPVHFRTVPSTTYKATGLFGVLSLILSVVLYLALMIGAHNEIKKKFGDDANVWPRPDWASGSAVMGSLCLLALAHQLAPTGYDAAGYIPI